MYAIVDAQAILQAVRLRTKLDKRFQEMEKLLFDNGSTNGKIPKQAVVKLCDYPWIPQMVFQRSQRTFDELNDLVQKSSKCLEIRRSSVGAASVDSCGLGVFATREITKDEEILHRKTEFSVHTNPDENNCHNCGVLLQNSTTVRLDCCPHLHFCDQECRQICESSYHQPTCGVDMAGLWDGHPMNFRGFETDFFAPAIVTAIFGRLFCICKNAESNMLEHLFVRSLTSPKIVNSILPWTLQGNVRGPHETLLRIKEDPYSITYDAWILQTVLYDFFLPLCRKADHHRYRVKNNAIAHRLPNDKLLVVCDPIVSLFNHSCDPNIYRGSKEMSSTTKFSSRRLIANGSEVFNCYLGLNHNIDQIPAGSKIQRKKILKDWFGEMPCACARCISEL